MTDTTPLCPVCECGVVDDLVHIGHVHLGEIPAHGECIGVDTMLDAIWSARGERDRARRGVDTLVNVADRLGDMVTKVVALIGADPEDVDQTPAHVDQVIAEHQALRTRVAELDGWRDRALQQCRRAVDDPERWNTLWAAADGKSTDLADMIDAILDQRDTARARVAELEAEVNACDEVEESWSASRRGLETMLMEERHRVQVLAAQREPIGYVIGTDLPGKAELYEDRVLTKEESVEWLTNLKANKPADIWRAFGLIEVTE